MRSVRTPQRAHLVNPEHPAVELGDGENWPHVQHRTRPWVLVAAATIVVLGIGLVATVNDPDSVQNDTVPFTPAPATNPATTSPSAPVDSPPSENSAPLTPADAPPLWVEPPAGRHRRSSPAPIPALYGSDLVWTGTELIVWGGVEDDQPCCTESHDEVRRSTRRRARGARSLPHPTESVLAWCCGPAAR